MENEKDINNQSKLTTNDLIKHIVNDSVKRAIKETDGYISAKRRIPKFVSESQKKRNELRKAARKDSSPFSDLPIKVFEVVESIISHFSKDLFDRIEGLQAKEEDITAALSVKITEDLIGSIESTLNGKIVGDYRFSIRTQKKQKQEAYTGADLVGVCSINHGEETVDKYFLLQAKIGVRREDSSSFTIDSRIQSQARKMLGISPASFFIIYTLKGFDVVSAMNVLASGKDEIDTRNIKSVTYENFNNLILDCFVGDNRFEKQEWRDYIKDPKNVPIPYEEALLHIIANKENKKKSKRK